MENGLQIVQSPADVMRHLAPSHRKLAFCTRTVAPSHLLTLGTLAPCAFAPGSSHSAPAPRTFAPASAALPLRRARPSHLRTRAPVRSHSVLYMSSTLSRAAGSPSTT